MAQKAIGEQASFQIKKVKTFEVGDLAVYPAHGVGRIESIDKKEINGENVSFYIMEILENSMVIMIPTSKVDSVGLRQVIPKKEISKVYEVITRKQDAAFDNQTWNRRYRDYMEKIKTGSLYDVAEVFRNLFLLKLTKDLSFGERKLLDTAQSLLVKELCTAKDCDEKCIMSEIESLFEEKFTPPLQ